MIDQAFWWIGAVVCIGSGCVATLTGIYFGLSSAIDRLGWAPAFLRFYKAELIAKRDKDFLPG
jgi:hypothetical protein